MREKNGVVALPEPPPRLRSGGRVRVTGGPFRGHIGLVAGMAARERVVVLLRCSALSNASACQPATWRRSRRAGLVTRHLADVPRSQIASRPLEDASRELGRDLASPELVVGRSRRVITAARTVSGFHEQMFGAKEQVPGRE